MNNQIKYVKRIKYYRSRVDEIILALIKVSMLTNRIIQLNNVLFLRELILNLMCIKGGSLHWSDVAIVIIPVNLYRRSDFLPVTHHIGRPIFNMIRQNYICDITEMNWINQLRRTQFKIERRSQIKRLLATFHFLWMDHTGFTADEFKIDFRIRPTRTLR